MTEQTLEPYSETYVLPSARMVFIGKPLNTDMYDDGRTTRKNSSVKAVFPNYRGLLACDAKEK